MSIREKTSVVSAKERFVVFMEATRFRFSPEGKATRIESGSPTINMLLKIPVIENDESFVTLKRYGIAGEYKEGRTDMLSTILGSDILVRKGVAERLGLAQQLLQEIDQDLELYVTYGYRSLDTQEKTFRRIFGENNSGKEPNMTAPGYHEEDTHQFVGFPTVAGHPTGGAVDLVIRNKKTGEELDFGSPQYYYAKPDKDSPPQCFVFDPKISDEAKKNRMLLRFVMLEAGFAPLDNEYWHFSYGDRESVNWKRSQQAFIDKNYADMLHAFYGPKTVEEVNESEML